MTDFTEDVLNIARKAVKGHPDNKFFLRKIFGHCCGIAPNSKVLIDYISEHASKIADKTLVKMFSDAVDENVYPKRGPVQKHLRHLEQIIGRISLTRTRAKIDIENKNARIETDIAETAWDTTTYLPLHLAKEVSDEEVFALMALVHEERQAFQKREGPYAGLN